jgi:hypothetical protein
MHGAGFHRRCRLGVTSVAGSRRRTYSFDEATAREEAMKIVQGDAVEAERGIQHRGGTLHLRCLLEGEPGTLDNFNLSLGQNGGDFYSPRHRHNFEQIRFQLEGTLDFGRDGRMTPGTVGYFPEGTPYGPQTQSAGQEPAPLTAVLQCGGASGSGYLSRAEVAAGMAALRPFGSFADGVFRGHETVPGKRNTDAFQAIWEHVRQRPMVYPEARYPAPILMDPAHFAWVALAGNDGVAEKLLGIFTEGRTTLRFLRLAPGGAYEAGGRGLYLVASGSGSIAGESFRRLTAVFLERGETARFLARETAEIFHMGLPDLAGLGAQQTAGAEAAE